MNARRIVVGSVHGRFQPFHNGHLEYFSAAKACCDFLWIGVTQYNPSSLARSPHDKHREEPANNPLTFFERVCIIEESLLEIGWEPGSFGFTPFPVESPDQLSNFLGTEVQIFTTVYDDWNRHKIQVLEAAGYRVIVLWERAVKEIDGVRVRNSIRSGSEDWIAMVSPATVRAVRRLNIAHRLSKR